ncbi:MAG: hypothetical protein HKP27_03480 [Myxococcales bacterium]|nr:hypothetical protein [Myxococcales bacterium]
MSSRPSELALFLHRMHHYMLPVAKRPVAPRSTSPENLARAFLASVDRGLENFRLYFRSGAYWGSYHNNFTADGRFLDLELPLLIGVPFFGQIEDSTPIEDESIPEWIGTQVFTYVAQVRRFVAAFQVRLRFLANNVFRGNVRSTEYLSALNRAFDEEGPQNHPIRDSGALLEWTIEMICSEIGAGRRERSIVTDLVTDEHALRYEGGTDRDEPSVACRTLPFRPADPEPGLQRKLSIPDFLSTPSARQMEAAQHFNDALREVDDSRNGDQLLERVRSATRSINATFKRLT